MESPPKIKSPCGEKTESINEGETPLIITATQHVSHEDNQEEENILISCYDKLKDCNETKLKVIDTSKNIEEMTPRSAIEIALNQDVEGLHMNHNPASSHHPLESGVQNKTLEDREDICKDSVMPSDRTIPSNIDTGNENITKTKDISHNEETMETLIYGNEQTEAMEETISK